MSGAPLIGPAHADDPPTAFDTDASLHAACAQEIKTRAFATGATRDVDNGKLDYEGFISPLVTRAYAEYMHRCRTRNVPVGSVIRDSDNWQKGIPQDVYAKSLIRHVQEFWLIHDGFEAIDEKGQTLSLEDVCCAIMFNVEGFLFEHLKTKASHFPGTISHESATNYPAPTVKYSPTE